MLVFFDVTLMLIFVYLYAQHSESNQLPEVDSSLSSTTPTLQVNVERLVMHEPIVFGQQV